MSEAVTRAKQLSGASPRLDWMRSETACLPSDHLVLVSERRLACKLPTGPFGLVELSEGRLVAGTSEQGFAQLAEEHRLWGGTTHPPLPNGEDRLTVTMEGPRYHPSNNEDDDESVFFSNPTDDVEGDGSPRSRAALSEDGRFLASAVEARIRVWRIASRELLFEARAPGGYVDRIVFSPDGSALAVSATRRITKRGAFDLYQSKVVVYDATTGHRRSQFDGEEPYSWSPGSSGTPINALAFFADNRRLATAYGGSVRIWDTVRGCELERYSFGDGTENRAPDITISPDQRAILVREYLAGGAYVLSLDGGGRQLLGNGFDVWSFSPGGAWLYQSYTYPIRSLFPRRGTVWTPLVLPFVPSEGEGDNPPRQDATRSTGTFVLPRLRRAFAFAPQDNRARTGSGRGLSSRGVPLEIPLSRRIPRWRLTSRAVFLTSRHND